MRAAILRIFMSLSIPVRRRLIWLAKSKYTLGVSAVVLDDRGDVLLLRHRWRETEGWDMPGGFVERGEDLEVALRRELHEETGLEVAVRRIVSVAVPRPLHVDVRYLARVVGGSLVIASEELVDARFFSRAELSAMLSRPYMDLIETALDGGEGV